MPNKARKSKKRQLRKIEHLYSDVETTITLKRNHKRQEVYPVPLRDVVSRRNVGDDAQVRMIGYNLTLTIASGNSLETVLVSVGHSGPWTRPAAAQDGFNQQFTDRNFNKAKRMTFNRALLHESERQFLNPDLDQNYLNLRIRDPCGVIPGVTMVIRFRCHLIRPTIDTFYADGDAIATDRYEDQNVSTGAPSPPDTPLQLPKIIRHELSHGSPSNFTTTNTQGDASYIYKHSLGSYQYTIVVDPKQKVNLVGEFVVPSGTISDLQRRYVDQGYDGTISQP